MDLRLRIALEYPIVFLSDPYGEDEVPSDTGAERITSTSTCVGIRVNGYTEGECDITLSDAPPKDAGAPGPPRDA